MVCFFVYKFFYIFKKSINQTFSFNLPIAAAESGQISLISKTRGFLEKYFTIKAVKAIVIGGDEAKIKS